MKKKSFAIFVGISFFFIAFATFHFLYRPSSNISSEMNAQLTKDYEHVFNMIKALDNQVTNTPKDLKNKEWVIKRLENMVNFDQAIRKVNMALFDQKQIYSLVQKTNRANAQELKEILQQYHWITISEFGKNADHNAWLLVQHQDHDRQFQEDILQRLKDLYPRGETSPSNYAYLFDRLAVAKGKPQLYGTQGEIIENKWQPASIEDRENLDQRRKKMEMPPYNEYIELISKTYNLRPVVK